MGLMRLCTHAYKSPTHFVWAMIGFTEKLSVDYHHKGHIVRHHYSNSLMVSSCNLNWFDTTVLGSMELNNRQRLQLPPIVCKSLKEAVHPWLSATYYVAALEQFEYQTLHVQIGRYLLHWTGNLKALAQHRRRMLRRHQAKCYHQF